MPCIMEATPHNLGTDTKISLPPDRAKPGHSGTSQLEERMAFSALIFFFFFARCPSVEVSNPFPETPDLMGRPLALSD